VFEKQKAQKEVNDLEKRDQPFGSLRVGGRKDKYFLVKK